MSLARAYPWALGYIAVVATLSLVVQLLEMLQ